MQQNLFPSRPLRRLIIVGCGKAKADDMCEAQDLYTGTLTRDRINHAKAQVAKGQAVAWLIASAWYRLLAPTDLVVPYEMNLSDLPQSTRLAWGWEVAIEIAEFVRLREIALVEIHAAGLYADLLIEMCKNIRVDAVCPVCGLDLAQSRAWYAAKKEA